MIFQFAAAPSKVPSSLASASEAGTGAVGASTSIKVPELKINANRSEFVDASLQRFAGKPANPGPVAMTDVAAASI